LLDAASPSAVFSRAVARRHCHGPWAYPGGLAGCYWPRAHWFVPRAVAVVSARRAANGCRRSLGGDSYRLASRGSSRSNLADSQLDVRIPSDCVYVPLALPDGAFFGSSRAVVFLYAAQRLLSVISGRGLPVVLPQLLR